MNFLVEHNAVDLLIGAIAKSKAPRATVSWTVLHVLNKHL